MEPEIHFFPFCGDSSRREAETIRFLDSLGFGEGEATDAPSVLPATAAGAPALEDEGVALSASEDGFDLPPAAPARGLSVSFSMTRGETAARTQPEVESISLPWEEEKPSPPATNPSPESSSGSEPPLLHLHCPECDGSLVLRREHLGMNGMCVWCKSSIVATESLRKGEIKVFGLSGAPPAPPAQHAEAEQAKSTDSAAPPLAWSIFPPAELPFPSAPFTPASARSTAPLAHPSAIPAYDSAPDAFDKHDRSGAGGIGAFLEGAVAGREVFPPSSECCPFPATKPAVESPSPWPASVALVPEAESIPQGFTAPAPAATGFAAPPEKAKTSFPSNGPLEDEMDFSSRPISAFSTGSASNEAPLTLSDYPRPNSPFAPLDRSAEGGDQRPRPFSNPAPTQVAPAPIAPPRLPATARTDFESPKPTMVSQSLDSGKKPDLRKGFLVLMVTILGFASGAALATYLLPVDRYVASIRAYLEEKLGPPAPAPALPLPAAVMRS